MQDKIIKCRDCGQDFVFTAGEQEFFALKGFSEPIRCSSCRAARKASRPDGGYSSAPRGDREMFPAVCGQCGKATQVPFQPRSDRPVYCSECYSQQHPAGGGRDRRPGGGGRSGGFGGRDRGRDRGRGGDRYDDRW